LKSEKIPFSYRLAILPRRTLHKKRRLSDSKCHFCRSCSGISTTQA
jgi:hypothetical protein